MSDHQPSFRARMVDRPALVSAIISGVILAILGFAVGIYSQLVTQGALIRADEQYLDKLQTIFKEATDKVFAQSESFSKLSLALGKAQAGAELAAKTAQDSATLAEASVQDARKKVNEAASASQAAVEAVKTLTAQAYQAIVDKIIADEPLVKRLGRAADISVSNLQKQVDTLTQSSRITLEENVDRPGGVSEQGIVGLPDPQSCRQRCLDLEEEKCLAYTFVPKDARFGGSQGKPTTQCFLKQSQPPAVFAPTLFSGVRRFY